MQPDFLSEAVLYQDYRGRNFNDYSGNDNDGVPTGVAFTGDGLNFANTTDIVVVSDSSELQLTEGTLVVFNSQGFTKAVNNARLISKRVSTIEYELLIQPTTIRLVDSLGVTHNVTHSVIGNKYVAANFASGEAGEAFVDGGSAGNFGGTSTFTADTNNLSIGNRIARSDSPLNPISAALIFPRKLTATEHSQLYGYLSNLKFPTMPMPSSQVNLKVNPSESSLVLGVNCIPQGNQLIDQSSVGNDGTLFGNIYHSKDLLGDRLNLDGVDGYINFANGIAPAEITIKILVNPVTLNTNENILQYGTTLIRVGASNDIIWYSDTANPPVTSDANALTIGIPNQIIIRQTGTAYKINVNGRDVGSGTIDAVGTDSKSIRIANFGGTIDWEGAVYSLEVFNEEKSDAWVQAENDEMNKAVGKTGWGANESIAAEGGTVGNFLSNTPFRFADTTFRGKISMDTINSEDVKVIEWTAFGVINVPIAYFQQTPAEGAFGKIEYYQKKVETGNIRVGIGTAPLPTDVGAYRIDSGTDEVLKLTESGVITLITAATAVTVDTWEKVTLTRKGDGEFELFLNDVSQGTKTDLTITENTLISMSGNIGDKIAYSSKSGNYAFNKSITI